MAPSRQLLGVALAVAVALGLAVSLWLLVERVTSTSLVTLRIDGHAREPWRGWAQVYRHSRLMMMDEDMNGMPDEYYVRYWGCPVTKKGAISFTVYRSASITGDVATRTALEKDLEKRRQYSRTLTQYTKTGNYIFSFPGEAKVYYFVRVHVQSNKGCKGWQFGFPGN